MFAVVAFVPVCRVQGFSCRQMKPRSIHLLVLCVIVRSIEFLLVRLMKEDARSQSTVYGSRQALLSTSITRTRIANGNSSPSRRWIEMSVWMGGGRAICVDSPRRAKRPTERSKQMPFWQGIPICCGNNERQMAVRADRRPASTRRHSRALRARTATNSSLSAANISCRFPSFIPIVLFLQA